MNSDKMPKNMVSDNGLHCQKFLFKIEPEDQWSCNAHLTPGLGQGERFVLFHNFKHAYSSRAWAYNHLVQVLAAFKAFIISIILYQFQKIPFASLFYDILFYFIHVYIAPGQGETNLGDNIFDGNRKV